MAVAKKSIKPAQQPTKQYVSELHRVTDEAIRVDSDICPNCGSLTAHPRELPTHP